MSHPFQPDALRVLVEIARLWHLWLALVFVWLWLGRGRYRMPSVVHRGAAVAGLLGALQAGCATAVGMPHLDRQWLAVVFYPLLVYVGVILYGGAALATKREEPAVASDADRTLPID